jgi:putative endonuclease
LQLTVNDRLQFTGTLSIIVNREVRALERKWFVYILNCADGTLYTGITNDLDRRIKAHNAGTASKYTRVRRPVSIVYSEEVETKGNALRRELQIKRLTRSEKMAIIMK